MHSTTCLTTTGHLRAAALAWWQDESGVAAIEYGLLAALIVIGAILGFSALGLSLSDLFTYWSEKVAEALDQIP